MTDNHYYESKYLLVVEIRDYLPPLPAGWRLVSLNGLGEYRKHRDIRAILEYGDRLEFEINDMTCVDNFIAETKAVAAYLFNADTLNKLAEPRDYSYGEWTPIGAYTMLNNPFGSPSLPCLTLS